MENFIVSYGTIEIIHIVPDFRPGVKKHEMPICFNPTPYIQGIDDRVSCVYILCHRVPLTRSTPIQKISLFA